MRIFGLYSAGGYAREIKSSLALSLGMYEQEKFEIVFIDDDESKIGTVINGSKVVCYEDFNSFDDKQVNVAFADPKIRKSKVKRAEEDGIGFFSISAPTCVKGDNVKYGDGAIFSENTIVTCDAVIGQHFHCNIFSYVAHDCIVGDFVTFAPRVSLNGRVIVEDMAYIGSDAIILPGKADEPLVIGAGAIIGAGALVTKSVAAGVTVVGSPAKPLIK